MYVARARTPAVGERTQGGGPARSARIPPRRRNVDTAAFPRSAIVCVLYPLRIGAVVCAQQSMLVAAALAALAVPAAAHASATVRTVPSSSASPPPPVPGCPAFHILHGFGLSHGAGNVTNGVESASACCALCAQSSECEAWSWHPAGTHVRSFSS
jgi:hypothetical protein